MSFLARRQKIFLSLGALVGLLGLMVRSGMNGFGNLFLFLMTLCVRMPPNTFRMHQECSINGSCFLYTVILVPSH